VEVKLDDPDRERKADKAKGKGKNKDKTEDSGKRDPRPSGRTIFVYGFDPKTDDDALTKHFGTVGAIENHHFITKVSAAITYVKESAAQKAVTKLDGSTMSGQKRYVDVRIDTKPWSKLRQGSKPNVSQRVKLIVPSRQEQQYELVLFLTLQSLSFLANGQAILQ